MLRNPVSLKRKQNSVKVSSGKKIKNSKSKDTKEIKNVISHNNNEIKNVKSKDSKEIRNVTSQNSNEIKKVKSKDSKEKKNVILMNSKEIKNVKSKDSKEVKNVISQNINAIKNVISQNSNAIKNVKSKDSKEKKNVILKDSKGIKNVKSKDNKELKNALSQNSNKIKNVKSKDSKEIKNIKSNDSKEMKNVESQSSKEIKNVESQNSKERKNVVSKDSKKIKNVKSKKRKLDNLQDNLKKRKSTKLTRKDILNYVTALYEVAEKEEKKRSTLFLNEKPPIFLLINCFKIPNVPLHQMRITLPNTLVTDNDDIALFVRDLKKGRRVDYEKTVQYYEDILQQHKCTGIKSVIPMNQVKTEYSQFELKRRLLNSYDFFLVDGRISGHMAHLLGKLFRQKRKLPTSIHMDKKDLKAEIDNALMKTSLQIHGNGDSSITQVGKCSMDIEKVVDNVMAVLEQLKENFPGGWNNIRSLRLKTHSSLAIPIYISLKNKNSVKVATQAPKRPKAYKDVEGELSTFTSKMKVIVAPDGNVNVQKLGEESSDEDDKENANIGDDENLSGEDENSIIEDDEDDDDNEDEEDDDNEDEEDDDNEDEEDDEDEDDDDDDENEYSDSYNYAEMNESESEVDSENASDD